MELKWRRAALLAAVGMIMPALGHAQGVADRLEGLNSVLDRLYTDMLPLCSQLIGVGRSIAGFAALWYICSRVWKHLAAAEPIDFYPLMRPFAIGICIGLFPTLVLGTLNGMLSPISTATAGMVKGSSDAVKVLLAQKQRALEGTDTWQMYVGQDGEGDRDKWYTHTYGEGADELWVDVVPNSIAFHMSKVAYRFQNSVKEWMSEILKVLFQAAALCINTLSTFQRIVLSILGPLVFGLAVFDGFGHSLTSWLSRYINVFLWVPVCNIFGAIIGKIQENMLRLDLEQIAKNADTFFSTTDTGYLIFMLIAIVGYFTVPSVANFVVNAGGGGALAQKVTSMASGSPGMAGSVASSPVSAARYGINHAKSYSDGKKYDAGQGITGALGRLAGSRAAAAEGKSGGGGQGQDTGSYQHGKLTGRR